MKATYEQLSATRHNSILYRQFSQDRFVAPYHFHPELELTLIQKGQGRRIIGRQIASFESGDLVFLGPNLPHTWLSDESGVSDLGAQAIVIQFKADCFGEGFWDLPEMMPIKSLFQKAASGVQVNGALRQTIAEMMQASLEMNPFQQMLQVLHILQAIGLSSENTLIDPHFADNMATINETSRFQEVYAYMIKHFKEDISLDTIAAVAHLSPSSFCRFFKKITRKTFVDSLTEFRIKYACQLLENTEQAVSAICFESGFGNLSHFNKVFKQTMGYSPLAYRQLFAGK